MPSLIESRFDELKSHWLSETAWSSSYTFIVEHPAYNAIIALGPKVVPLILRDLEQEPKHWHRALCVLTGADPVKKEHAGRIRLLARDWLAWAREHGYSW